MRKFKIHRKTEEKTGMKIFLKQNKKRLLAFAMAATCGLSAIYCPSINDVDAAGKKVTVYVLSSIENNYGKETLKYNKSGLIVKRSTNGTTSTVYKYDKKKRLKKVINKAAPGTIRHNTVTYSYDKKGRIKKMNSVGSHTSNTYTFTFSYDKKNRAKSAVLNIDGHNSTYKYKYNKKNLITDVQSTSSISHYQYDGCGNLIYDGTHVYQNSYNKNKYLTKRYFTVSEDDYEITYKYKKIKVDKKYLKSIKKQQWSLLNEESQIYFPIYG